MPISIPFELDKMFPPEKSVERECYFCGVKKNDIPLIYDSDYVESETGYRECIYWCGCEKGQKMEKQKPMTESEKDHFKSFYKEFSDFRESVIESGDPLVTMPIMSRAVAAVLADETDIPLMQRASIAFGFELGLRFLEWRNSKSCTNQNPTCTILILSIY